MAATITEQNNEILIQFQPPQRNWVFLNRDLGCLSAEKKASHVPTLQEARAYIYSIDFSNIMNKMTHQQNWSKSDVRKICHMYRNFLYLNRKYGNQCRLPPSEEIDEFWHNHILDTEQYRRDCSNIFGEYFDHKPEYSFNEKTVLNKLTDDFERMLKLYSQEFNGENVLQVRGLLSRIISVSKSIFMKRKKIKPYLKTT